MADPSKRRNKNGKPAVLLDDYPLYYMAHIVAESQRKIQEAIRPLKVSPNDWRVIFLLHDHQELSISDISQRTLIESSTLSRLLNSLEKRGLIRREIDDRDQRYTNICLTSDGREAYKRIIPVVSNQLNFTLQGLSTADKKTLLRILKTVKDNTYRSPFSV